MPKGTPTIVGSVRHKGIVYTSGMEKELAKVLSPADAQRLVEKGVISMGDASEASAPAGPQTPKSEPGAGEPADNK
jgi:hypothetical protein